VVLFRHEKTFYHKPGLFVRVRDDEALDAIRAKAAAVDSYMVNYVGIELIFDGFVIEAASGDQAAFVKAVGAVRSVSERPLILMSRDPLIVEAALQGLKDGATMIHAADADNWDAMAELAKKHQAPLAVSGRSLDELADLTEKIQGKGVKDLVLDTGARDFGQPLVQYTQIRRLALKKNYRPLGFPLIAFPCNAEDEATEAMLAAQAIAKYAGFIVLDHFTPEMAYPLLVLRENIYTDPQKPIQVQPGIYEINDPKADDPLLVTTNFSITYFSVANEVEGAGLPAWLLVTDAEGMSVLTAWAAGKFDSERIAKDVKRFGAADKIGRKRIVIPGHVAVLSGELEEELPGWEIRVGPREAVDLPAFMKQVLD
jgi:acetyl-CoA decarbonylase/synthase complex subunit gamma